jgi:hypothetical protein
MAAPYALPDEEASPFKQAGTGRWLTTALFFEYTQYPENMMFTTKSMDIVRHGKTLRSLKQLYLSEEDVTEYEFANKYLGGWAHWQALLGSRMLPFIEECREELGLKLRARGMKRIIHEAAEGRGTDAAKFLIDKGWVPKGRGRPSSAEKAKALAEDKALHQQLDDDFKRLELQ